MSARILVASLLIFIGSAAGETNESPPIFLKSVNLVNNPGFERTDGEGAANTWHNPENGNKGGSHSITDGDRHGGKRSATIRKGSQKRWASWWQNVVVSGDRKYRIGGWIKVEGGTLASVAIYFFDAEGSRLGIEGVGRKGATDWINIEKTITAPPGAVRGALHCGALHEGQVWFDDIVLEAVHNPAPRPLADCLYYPCVSGVQNLQIDGNLNEWKEVPRLKLGTGERLHHAEKVFEPEGAKWQGPADLSAEVALAWDAKNLYLAVETVDDKFPVAGEQYWQGDSVQFAIDTGHEKSDEPDENDYEVGLGLAKNAVETFFDFAPEGSNIQPNHVKSAVRATKKGYIVECAVPWKHIGIGDIAKRSTIGYSFLINDNDGKGRKWLEWASGIGMSKDPSLYATLRLLPARRKMHAHFRPSKREFAAGPPAPLPLRLDALAELPDPVQVALSLQGKNGKRLAHSVREVTLTPGTWTYDVALDTSQMKPGDYVVRAAVMNPGNESLAEDSVNISIKK